MLLLLMFSCQVGAAAGPLFLCVAPEITFLSLFSQASCCSNPHRTTSSFTFTPLDTIILRLLLLLCTSCTVLHFVAVVGVDLMMHKFTSDGSLTLTRTRALSSTNPISLAPPVFRTYRALALVPNGNNYGSHEYSRETRSSTHTKSGKGTHTRPLNHRLGSGNSTHTHTHALSGAMASRDTIKISESAGTP